jgi:cell wall-associated NlpC family hydrolase
MPAITRIGSLFVLPLLLVGLLATGSFVSTPAADAATARQTKVTTALDIALNQIGDRYRYGAAGPRAFDCSGLVYFSFRKAGFRHLPRTSSAQAHWLHRIRKSNIRRGDLMYFHDGSGVYHAGIFLKRRNGRAVMLDAPRPGERVGRTVAWTSSWYARTLRR